MSWIKKLMNTFFDDDNEDESLYEKEEQSVKKQPADEKGTPSPKPARTPAFKNGRKPVQPNNQHSAKMLHKYPENAPFRFPVIPDEKTSKKAPIQRNTYQPRENNFEKEQVVRREERSARSESRRSSSTAPNQKKPEPKRPAFKASHVPSPVYGFEKKNNSSQKPAYDAKDSFSENKSRFTPTDVPSPVYGYGKRKPEGILFIGRDIPPKNSIAEELLKSVDEALPAATEEIVSVSEERGENVVLEPVAPDEDFVDQELIVQETFAAEPLFELEPEQDLEQEQELLTEEAEVFHQEEKPEIFEEPIQQEDKRHNLNDVSSTEPVHQEKIEQEREVQQETAPVIKRETPRSGGQYVPFNVLMLKKDRQTSMSQPIKEQTTVRPQPSAFQSRPEKTVNENKQLYVPLSFLNKSAVSLEDDDIWLNEQKHTLQSTLDNFNVNAKVVHMTKGPAVTRFEVQPAPGVKVNKITNLTDDIKLSLAARDIRIEAPIPGKNAIGIEVPNQHSRAVFLREIIEHEVFRDSASSLTVALGLDISGAPVVTDLQKMPHGLIAGATGSGKSVCINSILVSLLYKAKPDEVRLLLVDPKMVELAPYNHIPHLVTPVITDAKEATAALKWAVEEMERRYEEFAKKGVREIKRYNEKMEQERLYQNKMPYIVVVIDELADLMMVSPQEVEEAICRIAQKARACGIHLLLATQRPSVDVITGLIKANVPTRTAFAVSSAIDSRTILDMSGAERLLGRGDMLFMENGSNKAVRIQGTFVSDEEIEEVTRYVKEEYKTDYLFTREELIQHQQTTEVEDELFEEACYYVIEVGAASSSSLQRRFRIGYNRAARLVDMMESFGLVSEAMGSKPRHVLLTQEELENRLYSQVD
ncbi:DNA translocase FtsK [Fictibacillus sp. BK138]|uniref:DNA translocase FtsK n=1 Tax=Fictibacillus sp. BK138 TaxID=2512121 RepID=UPI00102A619A|nr:DNA translocase FtsK [Fictibacillus sp. BK138]RZT22014.1 DNA translocase FtsK [Fictibacillus sp. BK138]